MADNKSCEGKYFASKEALEIRNQIWEKCLEHCFELTPQQVDTIIELYKKQKQKSVGDLTVNVDASDALKGLKAIQREARKAAAALKEFEEHKKKFPLSIYEMKTTCPRCGSENIEENLKVTGCNDCGWFE